MSKSFPLSEAPSRFLDAKKWAELRSFANNDLIALTYINAPYPDENNPHSFFCGHEGSFEEALRCYELGREIVENTRITVCAKKVDCGGKCTRWRAQDDCTACLDEPLADICNQPGAWPK